MAQKFVPVKSFQEAQQLADVGLLWFDDAAKCAADEGGHKYRPWTYWEGMFHGATRTLEYFVTAHGLWRCGVMVEE